MTVHVDKLIFNRFHSLLVELLGLVNGPFLGVDSFPCLGVGRLARSHDVGVHVDGAIVPQPL